MMEPHHMPRREEDRAALKRWWKKSTPYAQIIMGLGSALPAIYVAIVFCAKVSDAVAAIPIIQQQISAQQVQITANKAATDQGVALMNQKLDLTMEYLGVPRAKRVQ